MSNLAISPDTRASRPRDEVRLPIPYGAIVTTRQAASTASADRRAAGGRQITDAPRAPFYKQERLLTDDELDAIWRAAESETPFNAIIRVLILTGESWTEVAGMTWAEIAPDLSTWTIPTSRASGGGVARVIPLSWRTISVLSMIDRRKGVASVFADRRGRFKGFSKGKASLDAQSGVSGWTMEDLQRTTACGLQRFGLGRKTIGAAANQGCGISVAGRGGEDGDRAALRQWSDHVEGLGDSALAESPVPGFSVRALTRKLRLVTKPAITAIQ